MEFTLRVYDGKRDKVGREVKYKLLTFDEVKAIPQGARVDFWARQNVVKQVRVTSIKTWKTRPGDIRLGLKYGLYEYSYTEYADGKYSGGEHLVTEVTE